MAEMLTDHTFCRAKDIKGIYDKAIETGFLNEDPESLYYYEDWYYFYHWNGDIIWGNHDTHERVAQEQGSNLSKFDPTAIEQVASIHG